MDLIVLYIDVLQPSSEPLELPAPPPLSPQQLQLLHQLQQNEVKGVNCWKFLYRFYSLASC